MKVTAQQITGQCDDHIHYFSDALGIHKDMVAAWEKFTQAAAKDGFKLAIVSGFRNFERQLAIFNGKLDGSRAVTDINNQTVELATLPVAEKLDAILLFSALPGGSRHHWGCDIDVYDPELISKQELALEPWEYEQGGPLYKLNKWLDNNMQEYGFYRPYDSYRGGVAAEPWHLSYQPVAKHFEQQLTLNVINECLSTSKIECKDDIIANLEQIYRKYIINVGSI
ncbi:M15 family metallopeptidase [Thalassotalea crassostreae]|uniref:M15 family metallopeptidase n=1 Tax=Thalassotalea crassostreae TaxID=1763536 RepID=UPI0008386495|nr:M15 family metallopeptidase [Thalassotalea crassostreae]